MVLTNVTNPNDLKPIKVYGSVNKYPDIPIDRMLMMFKALMTFLSKNKLLTIPGETAYKGGHIDKSFSLTTDMVTALGQYLLSVKYDLWESAVRYQPTVDLKVIEEYWSYIDNAGNLKLVDNLIEKYRWDFKLTPNVTQLDLRLFKEKLEVTMDITYIRYILTYGSIAFKGVEIAGLGVSPDSPLYVIPGTLAVRDKLTTINSEFKLDHNFVLLEQQNVRDIIYVMNYGVYSIEHDTKSIMSLGKSLGLYLVDRLKSAIQG